MLEQITIRTLDDFFMDLMHRPMKGVYFYRINLYSKPIESFIKKYYEAARSHGVIIEGRIPNPDERNLSYYEEMMGLDFRMDVRFFSDSLRKWLPRMDDYQRSQVAEALYHTLEALQKAGKNLNMLKNAYIKFMCWLYYKFERIVNQLGANAIPKILYEGEVSSYERMLLSILSGAGCDIVLLQYHGDANYRKLDPQSVYSHELLVQDGVAFPSQFNLKWIRQEIQTQMDKERLYGPKPQYCNCTNAWIEGKGLADFTVEPQDRGSDPNLFYNCFYRINGVEDKMSYLNELYQFQTGLQSAGRKCVVANWSIQPPSTAEIAEIRRHSYERQDQMLMDLASNIRYTANLDLQKLMRKAFFDTMLEEFGDSEGNLNKLTNKAVYLLCWLKRYQSQLFSNWKSPQQIGCFIHMGGCKNSNEAMFLRFLARLPVDVLVLKPELSDTCCLNSDVLYEIHYETSLKVEKFPTQNAQIQMGTAAYHAERELDTIMYQDSGMYRNRQYKQANAISLQTTYEEIAILWNQELKYRPNFSTTDAVVNIPVIFAKVSGVKDGQTQPYWAGIKALVTPDTLIVPAAPYIRPESANPMKAHTASFLKNAKLQRAKIKAHANYPYGFLREEVQEHILDKLQLLLDQKTIKGSFENGTEYTIIAAVLNLNKEITRMMQRFDFTKGNPKFILINTAETSNSLEDAILAAFLNLAGFDVLFFVPTGYQGIEKYYNHNIMEEHQAGEYLYDLRVPDLSHGSFGARPSWREKLFKRGR